MAKSLRRDIQQGGGSVFGAIRSGFAGNSHLFSPCPQFLLACSCLVVACFFAAQSFAAPINHGTFMANTVTFVDVTEDTNSGDTQPLFGLPTVSGDSIDFNPIGFGANAAGAAGVDLTDGQLFFMVEAKPQFAINNIKLSEAGDTTMAGLGTDNTSTMVRTAVFIDILEVDGVGITPIKLLPNDIPMVFSPSDGDYGLLTDGGGGPFFHAAWMGMLLVDIKQTLIDNNVPFVLGATKITVNLDNTLGAISQEGTESLIAKKDTSGVIITVNIPEPTTAVMALWAMLGIVSIASRPRR